MFATGIECPNPTFSQGRIRRDLLEECGHYARWQEDLALTRELGLRVLRYGLPIHRVFLGPGNLSRKGRSVERAVGHPPVALIRPSCPNLPA